MTIERHFKLFEILVSLAQTRSERVFLVGGAVRDLLMGCDPADQDFDFMLEGQVYDYVAVLHEKVGGTLKKFPTFLTAKIVDPDEGTLLRELDIASARTESYEKPGMLPLVKPSDGLSDLQRRDFTVNAIALPLESYSRWGDRDSLLSLALDPTNGIGDLEDKRIRVLHKKSFLDDPTRLFRMCRYVTRLSFSIETETAMLARSALESNCLGTLSQNRKFKELKKTFGEKAPFKSLTALLELGIFRGWSPLGDIPIKAIVERMSSQLTDADANELTVMFLAYVVKELSRDDGIALMRSLSIGKKYIELLQNYCFSTQNITPDKLLNFLREKMEVQSF